MVVNRDFFIIHPCFNVSSSSASLDSSLISSENSPMPDVDFDIAGLPIIAAALLLLALFARLASGSLSDFAGLPIIAAALLLLALFARLASLSFSGEGSEDIATLRCARVCVHACATTCCISRLRVDKAIVKLVFIA